MTAIDETTAGAAAEPAEPDGTPAPEPAEPDGTPAPETTGPDDEATAHAAEPGGTADADTATPADTEDAPADDDVPAAAVARRRGPVLPVVLGVAALLVAALGAWFTAQAAAARDEPAAANTALVDTGTTAEVSTAVTSALNQVFSYSYDKPEVTERAAAEVLRGPALATYDQLFAQVRDLAPQQRIVLTTRVVHVAVQRIAGDRAQLLVFLDQSATGADDATTSSGAAQLSVTAERQGGDWLIIDLVPR